MRRLTDNIRSDSNVWVAKSCKFIFCLIVLFIFYLSGYGQTYIPLRRHNMLLNSNQYIFKRDTMRSPVVYCYSNNENKAVCSEHGSLSTFEDHLRSLSQTVVGQDSANIKVFYNGFSQEARRSFQYAVNIWRGLIKSDVPINVFATWRSLDAHTLGSAYSGDLTSIGLTRNFEGAIKENTWFPMAIAEKLHGKKINEDWESDIVANFNSDLAEWYYGIDGNCPQDKYDLASVILHEICHGLGFFSTNSRDTITGQNGYFGFYGLGSGYPSIFDTYVQDGLGRKITDKTFYGNPSRNMLNAYTSNDVYFNSKHALEANNNQLPKLYAPSAYAQGSSIAHLDEFTYPKGTINSLMGPIARKGEAVHDPGPIVKGIMDDLGWRSLRIFYNPLPDREDKKAPIEIKARIIGDDPLKRDSLLVYYSFDRLLSPFQTALMIPTGNPDEYSTTITPSGNNGVVTYYIEAKDVTGHVAVYPLRVPDKYLELYIQRDIFVPYIFHQPINQRFLGDTLAIQAYSVDNVSLQSVKVEYFVNGFKQPNLELSLVGDSGNSYSFRGYFPNTAFKNGGDSVRYRLLATDAAVKTNTSFYPENGWLKFNVEGRLPAISYYFNDFNKPTTDFLTQDGLFTIDLEKGFPNGAIHSRHPYTNGPYPFDFTSDVIQFRYPVPLHAPTSILTYDEVLLLQPAAKYSDYSSTDFLDYALVEGSKDKGSSWQVLTNPYNTNSNSAWVDTYNSKVGKDTNSQALGNATLYRRRVVNLLLNSNFIGGNPGTNTEAGDSILIRFRLIADEKYHGWGWAIDNFKLQTTPYDPSVDGGIRFVEDNLFLFPNPSRGEVNIEANSRKNFTSMNVDIRDIYGSLIYTFDYNFDETQTFRAHVPVKFLARGIYFFTFLYGDQKVVKKLIVEF